MKEMSRERAAIATAVLNGYLYAIGGRFMESTLDLVERYCPRTDRWTTLAPLLLARLNCGMVAFNDHLYVVGGCTGTGRNARNVKVSINETTSVERYDPSTNEWIKVQ